MIKSYKVTRILQKLSIAISIVLFCLAVFRAFVFEQRDIITFLLPGVYLWILYRLCSSKLEDGGSYHIWTYRCLTVLLATYGVQGLESNLLSIEKWIPIVFLAPFVALSFLIPTDKETVGECRRRILKALRLDDQSALHRHRTESQ